MITEFNQQIMRLEREVNDLTADNLALVTALRELENAVNHNVSGVKIELGEWLRLISQARKALGHRVVTP